MMDLVRDFEFRSPSNHHTLHFFPGSLSHVGQEKPLGNITARVNLWEEEGAWHPYTPTGVRGRTHVVGALRVWLTAQSSVGLGYLVWSNEALKHLLVVSWGGWMRYQTKGGCISLPIPPHTTTFSLVLSSTLYLTRLYMRSKKDGAGGNLM